VDECKPLLSGIFAQKSNMASPAFLNMIREVIRFGGT
jgi:predicted NAD/FAD-binding protein